MNNFSSNSHSLTQKFLFVMIIMTSFGELASIGNVNLSWLFAIVAIITYCIERFKQKNINIPDNINIKILLIFMIFWLFYGLVQMLFISDYTTGTIIIENNFRQILNVMVSKLPC